MALRLKLLLAGGNGCNGRNGHSLRRRMTDDTVIAIQDKGHYGTGQGDPV